MAKLSEGAMSGEERARTIEARLGLTYEIWYGRELIGAFSDGDEYRDGLPMTKKQMMEEFLSCVEHWKTVGKNKKPWSLVVTHP